MLDQTKPISTNHYLREIYSLMAGQEADAVTGPYYGIRWNTTIPNPTILRIASNSMDMMLHASLPIQSKMRRCILNDLGEVVYYLADSDSSLREDGITASDLTGAHGQVMVEIPEHWRRCIQAGVMAEAVLSEVAQTGFVHIPKHYISAYQASLARTSLKLSSVVNTYAEYRGGDNDNTKDEAYNTLLGRAVTNINRTQFRTYARNRNDGDSRWNAMLYESVVTLFWLFAVEYATFDSQALINIELTPEGYRQGGLGIGVTNMSSWDGYAFVPNGITNPLGNATGEIELVLDEGFGENPAINVNSYRGIEMPFGHLYIITDGANLKGVYDALINDTVMHLMVCGDPSLFHDYGCPYGYEDRGVVAGDGYISKMLLGPTAEIMPTETSEIAESCLPDYGYAWNTSEDVPVVFVSGCADSGSGAGLGYATAEDVASYAYSYYGSRLCFLPGAWRPDSRTAPAGN